MERILLILSFLLSFLPSIFLFERNEEGDDLCFFDKKKKRYTPLYGNLESVDLFAHVASLQDPHLRVIL